MTKVSEKRELRKLKMKDTVLHLTDPELHIRGRCWIRDALDENILSSLDRACRTHDSPGQRLDWDDDLLDSIGENSRLTMLARRLLPGARPVRILVFNKSDNMNWQVPWHQDRVIAVRDMHHVDGFENWTKKVGIWHVEPPIELLQRMIFARVHLDDTDEDNGCLELALDTHEDGVIPASQASKIAQSSPQEICCARRGDVLFVKALTLHRSRASKHATDRRTLRIDYCAEQLPAPLSWAL